MPRTITTTTFEVGRAKFDETRVVAGSIDCDAEVAAGRAVLAIDHFGLTANNITYAAFGDAMKYWQFFPAADGYGRVPVWGFADVIASPDAGLPVGTRVYGYFPMATHLVVTPAKISPQRFLDGAAHRRALPPVYNAYERVPPARPETTTHEAIEMLLRPLMLTSFLIADFLGDNANFGATQVAISSASSKTAIGLAQCLRRETPRTLSTIGLTSAGNKSFVERLGAYDHVVAYDDIGSLDRSSKTAFVDMAGGASVIRSVHGHFTENLVYSCRVGATHLEDKAGRLDVPGAKPVFFFAPSQIEKRRADWGAGGLERNFASVWADLVKASNWLAIERHAGPAALETAYRRQLAGKVAPETGLILSLK